jgi:hypothetical protein
MGLNQGLNVLQYTHEKKSLPPNELS